MDKWSVLVAAAAAISSGLNVAWYAEGGNPINLGIGVTVGIIAVWGPAR